MEQTVQTISAWALYGIGGLTAAVGALASLIALAAILSPAIRPLRGAALAGRGLIRRAEIMGRAFGQAVAWISLLMVLAQFLIVLLRYVFSISEIAVQESVTYMYGALFMLAAGYTLLEDGHVRVDIFYRAMGPRPQALVNLIGVFVFLLPFAILVLWWSLPYVEASWVTLEGSTSLSGLPLVFLQKTIIPAFAVLMILHGGLMAARAGFTLAGLNDDAGEVRDGIF